MALLVRVVTFVVVPCAAAGGVCDALCFGPVLLGLLGCGVSLGHGDLRLDQGALILVVAREVAERRSPSINKKYNC
jgi:hypothetical protein